MYQVQNKQHKTLEAARMDAWTCINANQTDYVEITAETGENCGFIVRINGGYALRSWIKSVAPAPKGRW